MGRHGSSQHGPISCPRLSARGGSERTGVADCERLSVGWSRVASRRGAHLDAGMEIGAGTRADRPASDARPALWTARPLPARKLDHNREVPRQQLTYMERQRLDQLETRGLAWKTDTGWPLAYHWLEKLKMEQERPTATRQDREQSGQRDDRQIGRAHV